MSCRETQKVVQKFIFMNWIIACNHSGCVSTSLFARKLSGERGKMITFFLASLSAFIPLVDFFLARRSAYSHMSGGNAALGSVKVVRWVSN